MAGAGRDTSGERMLRHVATSTRIGIGTPTVEALPRALRRPRLRARARISSGRARRTNVPATFRTAFRLREQRDEHPRAANAAHALTCKFQAAPAFVNKKMT